MQPQYRFRFRFPFVRVTVQQRYSSGPFARGQKITPWRLIDKIFDNGRNEGSRRLNNAVPCSETASRAAVWLIKRDVPVHGIFFNQRLRPLYNTTLYTIKDLHTL